MTAKKTSAKGSKKIASKKAVAKKIPVKKKLPVKQGDNREFSVGNKRPPQHTQFKPGQSGNPNGRPKYATLSDALRGVLSEGQISAEELAVAILKAVKKGNAKMAAIVFERTEGKVPQPITGDPDHPLEVVFRFVDEGVGGSNPAGQEAD